MRPLPITEPWVARAARLHPQRIAVDAPDATLTYAQLAAGAALLGQRLRQRAASAPASEAHGGVDHGSSPAAAIRHPASAAFAIALHACLQAGVVAVPIDARLPDAEQRRRAAGCGVKVGEDELSELVAEIAAAGPDAPASGASAAPIATSPAGDGESTPIAGSGADAATPAVRLSTSGTTGPGTPVLLSRGALLWNAIGSAAALGQPPGERWLSAMPVAHVGGLSVLTRSAIGATTAVLRPRFDAEEQLGLLMAGQATITSLVPTMLARLLDAGLDHPPQLRLVLLGGAPIAPALVERAAAAGISVAATYGLSEACSQVLIDGRALFCTRVALRGEPGTPAADDPAGTDAAGRDGELLVAGPTLATGAAGPGGWLATGDRGARVGEGSRAHERPSPGPIQVVGRIAETIVTGGENVAPTEVEAALVALPQIADAAVLGVPHQAWGEEVQARVILAPGATLDEPALRKALREALPPFAIPKRIVAVHALPRNANGKLLRRELR